MLTFLMSRLTGTLELAEAHGCYLHGGHRCAGAPGVWCVRPREAEGSRLSSLCFLGRAPHTRPGIEAWKCGTHQVELRRCFQDHAHPCRAGCPVAASVGRGTGSHEKQGRDVGCWEVEIGPDGRPQEKQSSGQDSATTSCPASSGGPFCGSVLTGRRPPGLRELVPPGLLGGGNGSGPHPWVTALSCLILRTCSAANEKGLSFCLVWCSVAVPRLEHRTHFSFADPPCGQEESPSSPRAFFWKRLVPPGPGDTEIGFQEQARW